MTHHSLRDQQHCNHVRNEQIPKDLSYKYIHTTVATYLVKQYKTNLHAKSEKPKREAKAATESTHTKKW